MYHQPLPQYWLTDRHLRPSSWMERGLRQGDPLSPFLFVLVAESLNLLIKKASCRYLWEGIEVCKGGPKLTHLQYADDTIMFCPPKIEYLLNIKKTLILFQLASGLQINFHKSAILGMNIEEPWLISAAEKLQCKRGNLPFTYLGLPIGGCVSRLSTWEPIIERMRSKLATWKGKLLSLGGRLTLIKASLSNLPLYYMSLFPIPHGIVDKITKLQRDFLWCGFAGNKSFPLVKWDTIQIPKNIGGLGVGNLLIRNLGLLIKWLWRFFHEPNSLWRQVIAAKYKYS